MPPKHQYIVRFVVEDGETGDYIEIKDQDFIDNISQPPALDVSDGDVQGGTPVLKKVTCSDPEKWWTFLQWDVTGGVNVDGTPGSGYVDAFSGPDADHPLIGAPLVYIAGEDVIANAVYYQGGGPKEGDTPSVTLKARNTDTHHYITNDLDDPKAAFFHVESKGEKPWEDNLGLQSTTYRLVSTEQGDVKVTALDGVKGLLKDGTSVVYNFVQWDEVGVHLDDIQKKNLVFPVAKDTAPTLVASYQPVVISTKHWSNIPEQGVRVTVTIGVGNDGGGWGTFANGGRFKIPPRGPVFEFLMQLATMQQVEDHERPSFIEKLEDLARRATDLFDS